MSARTWSPPEVVPAPAAGAVPGGVWLLTDRRAAARPLPELVAAAVAGGVRTVLLRERDLPYGERLDLAGALRALLAPVDGLLIVAGPDPLGGTARHLPDPGTATPATPGTAAGPDDDAGRGGDLPDRAPAGAAGAGDDGAAGVPRGDRNVPADFAMAPGAPPGGLVGWSWHGRGEVPAGAAYVTLSPVYPTRSKPGYGPALHPAGLAAGVRALGGRVPVVALGGIGTPAQVRDCLAAGAHAVAVLGALARADDPAALAAALVRATGRPPAATRTPPAPRRGGA
ncbi:hypothetical protein GCM10010123_31140 [Pilimelia anulata]|uniref:Thiamine phosphate synthase/TenI domain-containing protein n=1 Tax=Pilimelia anulata TaxID=53371 RepID=A0A8J3FAT5_9ACTN|nr:thiamine phosphate synthase [Pilimelia anulata]GGJ98982.1 hypothetical protein GCM10010123_31140 [Pilimelia anulata]